MERYRKWPFRPANVAFRPGAEVPVPYLLGVENASGELIRLATFISLSRKACALPPGMLFSVSGQYTHFMRLCTGFTWTNAAEQGVKRLGELIEEVRDEMQ